MTPDKQQLEIEEPERSEEKSGTSSKNRRGRKSRIPPQNFEDQANEKGEGEYVFEKKSSLEEFEELEKNVNDQDEYQVVTRNKNGDKANKKQVKPKQETSVDSGSKFDANKTFTKTPENAAEKQRLAKEKQEFRKLKEKYESDKLTLEKQKRDLDKQKLEFEKLKDVENKKLNAEKMKVDKERKAISRQTDKKKDDGTLIEKLYKEIEFYKDEIQRRDSRIEKLESDVSILKERVKNKDLQVQELQENAENLSKEVSQNTPMKTVKSKIPGVSAPKEKSSENILFPEKAQDKINIENNGKEERGDGDLTPSKIGKGSPNKPADEIEDEEVPVMEDTDEDFSLVFPEQYHGEDDEIEIVQESEGTKGKIFRLYSNDKREILFTNGVRKEIFPDGYSVVYFANEDIKQIFPDGKTVYYFADAGTVQTTLADGLKVYRFNNEQIEKHYNDGTKEIIFPDGTVKYIFGQDDEESIFPDGTIQRLTPDGLKVVEYPSGQKDIIYPDGSKERQYTSGKVKKMAADGKADSQINK